VDLGLILEHARPGEELADGAPAHAMRLMIGRRKGRHEEAAGKGIDEVGRLVTDAVGHGRVDVLDKVIVVAVKLMRVDADNGAFCDCQSSSMRHTSGLCRTRTIFLVHVPDLPRVLAYEEQVKVALVEVRRRRQLGAGELGEGVQGRHIVECEGDAVREPQADELKHVAERQERQCAVYAEG
jgi:hypothetical protein